VSKIEVRSDYPLASWVEMSNVRTFIAVPIHSHIRENASRIIERLKTKASSAYKWVQPNSLHLTLSFLGDIRNCDLPQLCREVQEAIRFHVPFECTFEGIGGFPSLKRPRVIWIGANQGTQQLTQLHHDLRPVCRRWRAPQERNLFSPHVTLGRIKQSERWNESFLEEIKQLNDSTCGSCRIDRVIVFSSFLDRFGPTYTPLEMISLKGS
jgi:RNA 2',3'-cyclic 3'-phosphodiesterase